MRRRRWNRAAPLLAVAAAALPAQAPTTLHAAWLQEVLDLDVAGAAAGYRRIAGDPQAPLLERLLAVARSTELQQHGVGADDRPPPPGAEIVPEVLRQHFAQAAQPQPVLLRELEAAAGDRDSVRRFFATTEVPQLRPLLVATALAAAEQSNPSAAERMRQLRSRFLPWSNDPARVLDRIRASQIVRAELDGQSETASTLRHRAFPNWRPQAWPEDVAGAWQHVTTNLAAWRRERQLTASEAELLARLERTLTQAAAADPAAALRLLDRMPLYAERLRAGVGGR